MMSIAAAMFREQWECRGETQAQQRSAQRKALKKLDTQINKLTDRLMEIDSAAMIRAYETKLEKLGAERVRLEAGLSSQAQITAASSSDFEPNHYAFQGLSGPYDGENKIAETLGACSNALFEELDRWEAHLSEYSDVYTAPKPPSPEL